MTVPMILNDLWRSLQLLETPRTNAWKNKVCMTYEYKINKNDDSQVFIHQFSGPGTAIGPLCVSVCSGNNFRSKWYLTYRYLARWCSLTISKLSSEVKVVGQSSSLGLESGCTLRDVEFFVLKWSVRPLVRAFPVTTIFDRKDCRRSFSLI